MAGAFIEFVRNAEKSGKKKGRLPILSAAKFFPFKEERELISLVRNEFERAMNANIELAFNGETFADSLEEMNSNESTLPSTFVEKSRAIANSVDSNARSSFSKQSEMIIGHPYFPTENARQIVETWHSNFLELCKSAETDTKAEISRIVATAKMQGWNKKQVETAVKERLPAKTKHRAELIARTELGKLNSSVNMETMKSVGVRYYKWLSTLDTRCRASHAVMNNVICSLDDPTIYFEDNPENGLKPIKHNRTASMVKLHPGFDFQCRCSMVMWEPEIDSKYEVKEEPIAEQQQIPQEKSVVEQKLEKAEKRVAKAEKELEVAKKAKSEVERKVEILRQANKRHSERNNQDILNRQAKRRKPFYKNLLTTDEEKMTPTDVKDLSDLSQIIVNLSKENKTLFGSEIKNITAVSQPSSYASTNAKGIIHINFATDKNGFNEGENLYSAWQKIKAGAILSEYEEYAIEVLWHEIWHNKGAKKISLPDLNHGDYGYIRMLMETCNQLVARHTYSEFLFALGGEAKHYEWVLKNGFGYQETLVRLRYLLKEANIDEEKFVIAIQKELLKSYRNFDRKLEDLVTKMSNSRYGFLVKFIERKDFLGYKD